MDACIEITISAFVWKHILLHLFLVLRYVTVIEILFSFHSLQVQVDAVRAGSVIISTTIQGLPSLEAAHAVVQQAKRSHTLSKALQRAGLGRVKVSTPRVMLEEEEEEEEATPAKELGEHSAHIKGHGDHIDASLLSEYQTEDQVFSNMSPQEAPSLPLQQQQHPATEGRVSPLLSNLDANTYEGATNESKDRLLAAQKASALVAARRASKEARALVALDAQAAAAEAVVGAGVSSSSAVSSPPIEVSETNGLPAPNEKQNAKRVAAVADHDNEEVVPYTDEPRSTAESKESVVATASNPPAPAADTEARDMRVAVFAFAATEVWHVDVAAGDSVEVRQMAKLPYMHP